MARLPLDEYPNYETNVDIEGDKDDDNYDDKNQINKNTNSSQKLRKSPEQSPSLVTRLFSNQRAVWSYVLIIGCILFAIFWKSVFFTIGNSDVLFETEQSLLTILKPMSLKFAAQDRTIWSQILSSLTNLRRRPVSPAVLLLISDKKSEMTLSCVAELITVLANKIKPNNKKWVFLNGTELSQTTTTDPGVLVESVKNKMQHSKVIVVSDIQNIPGSLASGFHFLVDQENPKIADAVYVLTVTTENMVNGKPVSHVEKILKHSWKDLASNILDPLITRVTEAVIRIAQEDKIGECPLKTGSTVEIKIP